jgi:glycosyltransferase involved in cell wall biosynthesis
MESFVAQERLTDSVIFEGALSHQATRRRLAQADIFVLASFAEGLPIALMEAMAMEIPCISTFVAGIPELLRDQLDGLLVPASSEQSLCAALVRFISDREFRRAVASSARSRVQELYDLKRNVSILANTLRHCLSESHQ